MFSKLPILTALTTFTLIAPFAFSDGQTQSIPHSLVTQSFSEVKETIDQEVLEHGADQVLIVFDIDNTTLSPLLREISSGAFLYVFCATLFTFF